MNKGSLIFVFVLTMVIIVIIVNLVNRIAAQKQEEERKKLALQVLSHEMRTPASSILLSIETINQHFEEIPETLVEPFIRISNEAFRLKRLIDKSRHYLATNNDKRLIQAQIQPISSTKEFIDDILDKYPSEHFVTQIENCTINSDPYWLGVALTNLIENALGHGVKPISVSGKIQNEQYVINVQDQGQIDLPSFKVISKEFHKGTSSKGSGLGLTIVSKIITALNGTITLTNKPTTFIISLPYSNEEKNEKNSTNRG